MKRCRGSDKRLAVAPRGGTTTSCLREDRRMYTADALNSRFSERVGIGHWHIYEGRHRAVSIMDRNGVPLQEISDTVGHKSTHVTETVYRHVIVPAIRGGASVMDAVFGDDPEDGSGAADVAATP